MLKIGTHSIAAIRLGAQTVKKAYLGNDLVFGVGEKPAPGPSRLPDGYTEVEYIQSDGGIYLDTGVKPRPSTGSENTVTGSDTNIAVDVEPLDAPTSTEKYIVYATSSGNNGTTTVAYHFQIYWKTTKGAYGKLNKTGKSPVDNTDPRRMHLELNGRNKEFVVDGEISTFSDGLLAYNNTTIKLFGNPNATTSRIKAKLYSCQIYKGTDLPLVRDFVPCVDPTGAVGLYDLVDDQFYANSGTGIFTAGSAV